jgi:2-amino-4-hydroxy-6-hydroxymethyldihydropteridine diphosphokinase
MEIACIGLGSNIGDREKNIQEAVKAIAQLGSIGHISSLYETEPEGFKNQPDFLNGVLDISTALNALTLLSRLKQIEMDMGREKTFRNAPRIIDLDILVFVDQIIKSPELEVPHPSLRLRAFVLVPMVEIMPLFIHPVTGESIKEMLEKLDNPKRVTKWGVLKANRCGG